MQAFLCGLAGAVLVLAAFALGWAIGSSWVLSGHSSAPAPWELGRPRSHRQGGGPLPDCSNGSGSDKHPATHEADEQRRAFEAMMNFDVTDAYGMNKGVSE